MASMLLVLMGQAKIRPRTIEAEAIILRDSHGRARIAIGTPEFTGAAVNMKPDAPGIWLSAENGSDEAILTTDGLRFGNAQAKPVIELSVGASTTPSLRFYDADGKAYWSAP